MNEYRALIRRSEFINVTVEASSEEEARDIIDSGLWPYSEFSDYGDDLEIISFEEVDRDEDPDPISVVLADYEAWEEERERLWRQEEEGGPPASQWHNSDDEAVRLLERLAEAVKGRNR